MGAKATCPLLGVPNASLFKGGCVINAGAPLDHVNNLRWTVLIESIVFGDGGKNHTATLKVLVEPGANVNIPDGRGATPLALTKARGYTTMVKILEAAGAK